MVRVKSLLLAFASWLSQHHTYTPRRRVTCALSLSVPATMPWSLASCPAGASRPLAGHSPFPPRLLAPFFYSHARPPCPYHPIALPSPHYVLFPLAVPLCSMAFRSGSAWSNSRVLACRTTRTKRSGRSKFQAINHSSVALRSSDFPTVVIVHRWRPTLSPRAAVTRPRSKRRAARQPVSQFRAQGQRRATGGHSRIVR